ncbi:fatty acyl-CoA reductase wat-like [Planococcus citri]|uniref:fatty acyl-CoA reductase wat-like n=1 Tax=Planococcus citri TaxID=170843 RepID=UPI0031F7EB0C
MTIQYVREMQMSDVENFYAGKTIFITGVTGFLGQVLLSKLLCSCPDFRCIYILIREKKGKLIHERFKEIFDSSIFRPAKKLNPNYETKIKLIKGDCCQRNLGVSEADQVIIENEVEIIFHAAATVRFDAVLREAAYINIRSTNALLNIAKNMKNLKAFMYVSTAFSACAERELIEEKFYDPPIRAHNLLTLVEQLNDTILDRITPELIKPHPNTYIYTKIIAENLCRDRGAQIPICIFRPSIIAPCYKEPAPGWINNSYGPVGAIVAYALGSLKVARANGYYKADMVPGDYVVNALIVFQHFFIIPEPFLNFSISRMCAYLGISSGCGFSENKSKSEEWKFDVPIINNYSNSTTKFTFTWASFIHECDKALEKYPFHNSVTLPMLKLKNNPITYRCMTAVLHSFPAFIIDTILNVLGKKPKFGKLYEKMHKLFDLLTHFSTNEWVIPSDNVNEMWRKLSQKDKDTFYFNLDDLNTEEYFGTYIRGLRLYIANEEEHTLKSAIKKRRIFLILQYLIIAIVILIFLYVLACLLF